MSSRPPEVWETIAVRSQVPVADEMVQVTIADPPEHWKMVENVVVEKLLGLEVIAELAQFDAKVPGNVAVVLGPFNW